MKTYVMVARHLGKVSGEKIYTNNKMRYLLSAGWRVVFLSCKREATLCDNKTGYEHYVYPALTYAPECYTRREIRKTIESIASVIGNTGEEPCLIESDSLVRAVWAELIAKRIKAKHLAFLLQEGHAYDGEARAFLKFKYNRHELAGISPQSINQILADDSIERRDDTQFTAFCDNTIEECEDPFTPQLDKEAAYTFGSFGRLDKGCVPAILQGFMECAAAHPDKKYNVVMIGGSLKGNSEKQITETIGKCGNIHLLITGYIYPVPASLIRKVDVFVSTAGAAYSTYRFHRPTIWVHPITGEPCGIFGLDDMAGKSMFDTMEGTTIAECIRRALTEADKIVYRVNYDEGNEEKMYAEYARQLSFADAEKSRDYYDEKLLLRIKTTRIRGHGLHWIVGHLAGAKGLNRVIDSLRKLN